MGPFTRLREPAVACVHFRVGVNVCGCPGPLSVPVSVGRCARWLSVTASLLRQQERIASVIAKTDTVTKWLDTKGFAQFVVEDSRCVSLVNACVRACAALEYRCRHQTVFVLIPSTAQVHNCD